MSAPAVIPWPQWLLDISSREALDADIEAGCLNPEVFDTGLAIVLNRFPVENRSFGQLVETCGN